MPSVALAHGTCTAYRVLLSDDVGRVCDLLEAKVRSTPSEHILYYVMRVYTGKSPEPRARCCACVVRELTSDGRGQRRREVLDADGVESVLPVYVQYETRDMKDVIDGGE